MLAQRALAILGLVLLAYAVPRLARLAGRDPVSATWLVVASPFVLVLGVGGAHNDLILTGFMAVALLAAAGRPGWVAGAALAGVAAATKIPGAAVCVGVVLLSLPPAASLRARLARTAAVGAIAAAVVLGLGWIGDLGVGWVSALGVPLINYTPLSLTTDLGWMLHFHVPGIPFDLALVATRTAGLVVTAVALAVVVVRGPTGNPERALLWTAGALLVVTVLSPVVRAWYFLWCVPALAWTLPPPRAWGALVGAVLGMGLATAPLHRVVGESLTTLALVIGALVGMSVALLQSEGERELVSWGPRFDPPRD
jgi:alpha-1,6-mannosyltransferase